MNKKQIQKILEQTKNRFLENDSHLLSIEANERSITHKFAEHLQNIIGCSWNVDCEYNRFGSDSKVIEEIKVIVGENTTTSEIKTHTVYPDIIVHKRGLGGINLLVIEAKKDATKEEKQRDEDKLKEIKEKYQYEHAVFINFKTGTEHSIKFEFIKPSKSV